MGRVSHNDRATVSRGSPHNAGHRIPRGMVGEQDIRSVDVTRPGSTAAVGRQLRGPEQLGDVSDHRASLVAHPLLGLSRAHGHRDVE